MSSTTAASSHDINQHRRAEDLTFVVDEKEDKNARKVLKKIGFDPEQVNTGSRRDMTPMIWFCREGDFKMCRYLSSRGADCTVRGGTE